MSASSWGFKSPLRHTYLGIETHKGTGMALSIVGGQPTSFDTNGVGNPGVTRQGGPATGSALLVASEWSDGLTRGKGNGAISPVLGPATGAQSPSGPAPRQRYGG